MRKQIKLGFAPSPVRVPSSSHISQRLTSQESCDKSPMERMRNAISFGRINEKNKRKSDAFRIYFENEQKRSFFRYHAGAWRFIEPLAPRLRPFDSLYLLITQSTIFLFYFFFLRSKNRANDCSVLYLVISRGLAPVCGKLN